MRIGVMAIIVLAMPAAVYCTAINEKPTPIKGPVKTATSIAHSPLCSFRLDCICPAFPLTNNQAEKQNNHQSSHRIALYFHQK